MSKFPQSTAEVARIKFDPERIELDSAGGTLHGHWRICPIFTFLRNAKISLPFLIIGPYGPERSHSGPCFAHSDGTGSERSHNGFRDHSHSEQHPISGVHLFCRDSDLVRLSAGSPAIEDLRSHISTMMSLSSRRRVCDFEVCDLRLALLRSALKPTSGHCCQAPTDGHTGSGPDPSRS